MSEPGTHCIRKEKIKTGWCEGESHSHTPSSSKLTSFDFQERWSNHSGGGISQTPQDGVRSSLGRCVSLHFMPSCTPFLLDNCFKCSLWPTLLPWGWKCASWSDVIQWSKLVHYLLLQFFSSNLNIFVCHPGCKAQSRVSICSYQDPCGQQLSLCVNFLCPKSRLGLVSDLLWHFPPPPFELLQEAIKKWVHGN